MQSAHDSEEQGTPKASDNICGVCNLPRILLIPGATLKCSCGPHELVAADDSIPDTADIRYRVIEACQKCDWCGGGVGKPCLRPDAACVMHKKIADIRNDIAEKKERCAPERDAHVEYGQLGLQKLHIQKVEHRLKGGPWLGSKECE